MKVKYRDLVEQTFDWPQEEFYLEKGQLHFHDIPMMDLVEKYGSPLKFSFLPKIGQNIEKARGWFKSSMKKLKYKGNYHYCYVTKSSHFHFVMDDEEAEYIIEAVRFLAEEGDTFAARNYFLPGGGPGSLIMVAGVGVLETAAHPDTAQQFVEFLLSAESQQYFADETYEYPVVEGVAINPLLPPLAALDAEAIDINLSDMADLPGTAGMLSEVGILP